MMHQNDFFDVKVARRFVVNFFHAYIMASLDGIEGSESCQGYYRALLRQLVFSLILQDLLACLKAIENWHLEVHDNYSIPTVFALRINTATIFIALFEHLECLLAIASFVNANFLLMNNLGF